MKNWYEWHFECVEISPFVFHRWKKLRFGMTQWGVNDDSILILGWTIPLNVLEKCQIITEMSFLPILRWEMAPEYDWTDIPTLIIHSWFDELSSAWLYLRNTDSFLLNQAQSTNASPSDLLISTKLHQVLPEEISVWFNWYYFVRGGGGGGPQCNLLHIWCWAVEQQSYSTQTPIWNI